MDLLQHESKVEWQLTPEAMDHYLANAWRHFGPYFVRYQGAGESQAPLHVLPLRIALDRFSLSRSHRRILRRNSDLLLKVLPTEIDNDSRRLFDAHKVRFPENVDTSLDDYFSPLPAHVPVVNLEFSLWLDSRKLAASFLDLGQTSVSSLNAVYDPAEARRSLGILTMLLEIDFACRRGCQYYYHGYAYQEPSRLDYKKQFTGLEYFDWQGHWHPFP